MAEPQAVVELRKHIDGTLRVGLTDGRVIVGTFICFDKQRNVLLVDALEWRYTASEDQDVPERAQRNLGIVIVP